MSDTSTIEVQVRGMDCAECARHVQHAISGVPGVLSANVLLASEKAVIEVDPSSSFSLDALRAAVRAAGYSVPEPEDAAPETYQATSRRVLRLLGLVFGAVLLVVVAGEWLGLFESLTSWIPFPVGVLIVGVMGYPVFAQVVRAALKRRIIAHSLMSLGAVAALVAGEWVTAAIVVFFMRVGDFVERFTAERARESVRALARLAPSSARVLRDGDEVDIAVEDVLVGDRVVVRPGERIPVDGRVSEGQASVDTSAVTGEGIPSSAGPGETVLSGSVVQSGALVIETVSAGPDSTFGRIIRLVEEAEARRGTVQRVADRFSAYYLPLVAGIAILTYVLRQDVMATVAVLVVACSCAFALATPVAILASIGAGARRGLLVKGGLYLERLAQVDVLLLDKTGTVTFGRPKVTDALVLDGLDRLEFLSLAASAERRSEHPLAEAVRTVAREAGAALVDPESFESYPGRGIRAVVKGRTVSIGNASLAPIAARHPKAARLQAEGKSLLFVDIDGEAAGILAAEDVERPEAAESVARLREMGLERVEMLTGDREASARALAGRLGVTYRAELLPEDKIEIVRKLQSAGHVVAMVGDGINDAPALAQADVGIAMGVTGTDIATEAAHVVLLRDDWNLVPDVFETAKRTMRVVHGNIGFTAVYNLVGISLAAFGFLPPILAAAAQSLPDLGILANSARLIRR